MGTGGGPAKERPPPLPSDLIDLAYILDTKYKRQMQYVGGVFLVISSTGSAREDVRRLCSCERDCAINYTHRITNGDSRGLYSGASGDLDAQRGDSACKRAARYRTEDLRGSFHSETTSGRLSSISRTTLLQYLAYISRILRRIMIKTAV